MWYPSNSYEAPDPIEIFAGDVIKLTVVALSPYTGNITIENLTNDQRMSKSLNSSTPLCGQNVAWIVEDYTLNNSDLVPFADFDTVTFANAVATGTGSYDPSGATILDITQNHKVLTNVTTNGASVTIQYV
ncbi:peptidase G1 [Butyriboletus roseoflavus]|nr:peptidase G1 [Butyriboletus roseoflavus]